MNEELYNNVRKFLLQKNLNEAESLYYSNLETNLSDTNFEAFYWRSLIEAEIFRTKNEYRISKEKLMAIVRNRFNTSLNFSQRRRLYGRLGVISYNLEEYEETVNWLEPVLPLCTENIGRYNYYNFFLLKSLKQLNNQEKFSNFLFQGLSLNLNIFNETRPSSTLNYLNDLLVILQESPNYRIIISNVENFIGESQNNYAEILLSYFKAIASSKLKELSQFCDQLQICVEKITPFSKELKFQLYWNLSYQLENTFSDYQRAKELLEKCLIDYPNPCWQRISLLNKLGSLLRFIGDYNQAINYLEESIDINTKSINDTWYKSYSHNTLGMIHTFLGDVTSAHNHYGASLSLSENSKDFYSLGYVYGALGWLNSNQGSLIKAKHYYENAINTFLKISKSPPSIILLAYAEMLAQLDFIKNQEEIESLLKKAEKLVEKSQRPLDYGRYYNSKAYILLHQKEFQKGLKTFRKALEYSESFEVETRTLLGMSQASLELYISIGEEEYLNKTELYLKDLKNAVKASKIITGEVELLLGIITLHNLQFSEARDSFERLLNFIHLNNLTQLEEKVYKQFKILQILQKQQDLDAFVHSSQEFVEFKTTSIREMIDYIKEILMLLSAYDEK
ncbi:tetratricopeptide repeat protein [Candidatus Hodarchaeum mangrovi]